jgi:electron transport complex protein RnfB
MIPVETTIANWKWPAPAESRNLIATDRGRGEQQHQEAH